MTPTNIAVPLAAVLAFAGTFAPDAVAQEIEKTPPPAPSVSKPGDAPGPTATRLGRYLIGDPAPDIEMKDEAGKSFNLSDERKQRPMLIGFARMPEDAIEIERARPALEAAGIGAIVIAPFHRDRLADIAGTTKVRFIHDRSSRYARLYGLFDAVTSNPQPGAFLIDERQRIRLIVAGIMPSGNELARSAIEALEQARNEKVAKE